jgi:predicted CXXCH cytochrome family protein
MKAFRTVTLVLTAVAIGVGFGSVSLAFHDGGVGECAGCHNMHGAVTTTRLLAGSDTSSTCLNCHENEGDTGPSSYHVSTAPADMGPGIAPLQRTPGGDFGWLKKTYTWTVPWGSFGEAGQTHGHNIVADDYDYVADSENTSAPGGGTLPASALGCASCHDPHGKYRRLGGDQPGEYTIATGGAPIAGSGSYQTSDEPTATEAVGVYRLLAGIGFDYGAGIFTVDPPAAIAPTTTYGPGADPGYNQSEAVNQVRVAYGEGMADWCVTCHPDMDNGLAAGHHPVDQAFSGDVLDNYVQYRGSGNVSAANTNADAFLSLVPYGEVTGADDYGVLKALAAGNSPNHAGPELTGGAVTCLSCHRAHASGFEYALRWNPESELIVEGGQWPGTDNGASPQFARGRTEAEMQAAYYDRDASVFATYQRSLCNKCHAQD